MSDFPAQTEVRYKVILLCDGEPYHSPEYFSTETLAVNRASELAKAPPPGLVLDRKQYCKSVVISETTDGKHIEYVHVATFVYQRLNIA